MTDLTRGTQGSRRGLDLATVDPRKAIRHARRHSLLVRLVRVGIIVSSVLAIASLAFIALFDPFKRLPGNISVGHVGMQGSRVTMAAPKMSGMRPNGQPFELRGVSGIQDILKPNVVELFTVDAKIGMDDSSTSKITAQSGIYDGSKNMIWLKGNVHIVNDSGYAMRMLSAVVNIKSSALITNEPVVMLLNGGRVIADRMDIEDDGHKISFDGDVKVGRRFEYHHRRRYRRGPGGGIQMRRIRRALRASCLMVLTGCGFAYLTFDSVRAETAHATAAQSKEQSKTVHVKSTAAQSDNKEPINIQAAKLDYFDKQQKLIYRGHVIAVQGDTTLKTPQLVVFLNPKEAGTPKGPPSSDSQVRRWEASGPVTIITKDQVATGDFGTYEKGENKIYLNGNVTWSQGPNVTKGDHLVYDQTTGQAVVTGNVSSMFLPNNNDNNNANPQQ